MYRKPEVISLIDLILAMTV